MMTAESGARDPIKVGVIGCGRIGIVHLGAINKAPGVVPVIVSNPTVSKAEDGEWKFAIYLVI
jgi:myo-inositol 2-dehydrogenase/D-chiro-inositol 1-dehydrogenase